MLTAEMKEKLNQAVRDFKNGLSQAFDTIFDLTSDAVFRICVNITGDYHGAEDVMQEVFLSVFKAIPDFRPHSVFTEIIKEIEKHGLSFINSITYLEDYTARGGLNNSVEINMPLENEIVYAVDLARKIVDLDIGQTVVFKDKAVVAVEALEGTDSTIKRAYRICGAGFIVIKLARRNQDLRFDPSPLCTT